MLAQDPRRQVCRADAHGRELEAPAGKLLEGDAAGRNLSTVPEISSTGAVKCLSFIRMIDSRVCLTRFMIFSYSISQLGIALGLLGYSLPDVVVLPRVGRHVGQDGHLVDVGVVFWVDVLELRVERGIAGAGQAGKSLVDLDEGITEWKLV